jgi:hypothetical protein
MSCSLSRLCINRFFEGNFYIFLHQSSMSWLDFLPDYFSLCTLYRMPNDRRGKQICVFVVGKPTPVE